MCEIHYYRCACGHKWEAHKKLASCKSSDPDIHCPEYLCMLVGLKKKPQRGECNKCRQKREDAEVVEEGESDTS
jgi:hypothetical protein